MPLTVTVTSVDYLSEGSWSALGDGDTYRLTGISDDGPGAGTSGQAVIELLDSAGNMSVLYNRRFRVRFQTNFEPSFIYSFNAPFEIQDIDGGYSVSAGEGVEVDFDTTVGYVPPAITSLGGGNYQVAMHFGGANVTLGQRFQSEENLLKMTNDGNSFIHVMIEQASLDAVWTTGDTLADVIAADPTVMEEDHDAVDQDGNPIDQDESGGPPPQTQGMAVYTNVERWNFVMDDVDGTGGLMGVEATAQAGTTGKHFFMFVPYQLAIWMGVDETQALQAYGSDREVRDSGWAVNRIGAFTSGNDYSTDSSRGWILDIEPDFSESVFERSLFGARADESDVVLVGNPGDSPCFAAGTLIPVTSGVTRPVEAFANGDAVMFADGTRASVHHVTISVTTDLHEIPRHAFGRNLPSRTLRVTGNHLVRLPAGPAYRADELAAMGLPVTRVPGRHTVHHLGLERWGWLRVHDIRAETEAWKPEHHAVRPYRKPVAARAALAEKLRLVPDAIHA